MAGEIAFTPTEADHVAASRANYLTQLTSRRFRHRMLWLFPGMGIALFLIFLAIFRDAYEAVTVTIAGVLGGSAALAIIVAGNFLLLPRRAARIYRQQPSLRQEQRCTWDASGTHWRSATGSATWRWEDYYRWRETRAAFLFYANELMPHYIPARALDEAKAADLRATLEVHGPPPY